MNGWQNVVNNHGVMIAAAGMIIVFAALAIISGFIALLPQATRWLAHVVPEPDAPPTASVPVPQANVQGDESIAAAIGYAMHLELHKSNERDASS